MKTLHLDSFEKEINESFKTAKKVENEDGGKWERFAELIETKEEFDYLMGEMYPSMIVGGFTTVTITSVIIAGLFTNLL